MKNQREPSAGKGVTRGHGKAVQMCSLRCVCDHSVHYCRLCVCAVLREVLKEDESGSLKATVEDILYQSKRKRCVCVCVCNFFFILRTSETQDFYLFHVPSLLCCK